MINVLSLCGQNFYLPRSIKYRLLYRSNWENKMETRVLPEPVSKVYLPSKHPFHAPVNLLKLNYGLFDWAHNVYQMFSHNCTWFPLIIRCFFRHCCFLFKYLFIYSFYFHLRSGLSNSIFIIHFLSQNLACLLIL